MSVRWPAARDETPTCQHEYRLVTEVEKEKGKVLREKHKRRRIPRGRPSLRPGERPLRESRTAVPRPHRSPDPRNRTRSPDRSGVISKRHACVRVSHLCASVMSVLSHLRNEQARPASMRLGEVLHALRKVTSLCRTQQTRQRARGYQSQRSTLITSSISLR
jgi:hypothetical protein